MMIHTLSAYIHAHQRGMLGGVRPGNFGQKSPQASDGPPKSAGEVAGPTDGVRKAEKTADRNRSAAK